MMKKILKTIGILILAVVLFISGEIVGSFVTAPLYYCENNAIVFGKTYLLFIGLWITFFAFCLIFKPFRKMFKRLWIKEPGNNVKTALSVGLVCGLGLNLLIAFVAMLNGDISLSFLGFNPLMIIYFILVITIQSGAEEIMVRWFVYQKLREYFKDRPAVAIILNASLFAALHLFNPGVTLLAILNIALAGLLYSLIVYYYKSFWAAVVAHASWNFCQNILLGLPNSGIVTEYSIFKLDVASARDSFAYSTAFGIEGTVTTCLVFALVCALLMYLNRKKDKNVLNEL